MTRDIIELALESEFGYCEEYIGNKSSPCRKEIVRFAALLESKVRADERKECAAICRKEAAETDKHLSIVIEALEDCAYLIEKRGEK